MYIAFFLWTIGEDAIPLQVFLLFGQTGWIGGLLAEILKNSGKRFEFAIGRLEDRSAVRADIERVSKLEPEVNLWEQMKLLISSKEECLHSACFAG